MSNEASVFECVNRSKQLLDAGHSIYYTGNLRRLLCKLGNDFKVAAKLIRMLQKIGTKAVSQSTNEEGFFVEAETQKHFDG